MEILVCIVILIYIVYNWESLRKNKGYPETLSDTYYLWPKWVFPTVMTLVGFCLLPTWLDATEGSNLQFLSFMSCVGLIFVGCVPDFRNDKNQYKIHVICGYLAAGAALLSLMFVLGNWWLFPIILLINIIPDIKRLKEHYIYHIEDAIIISVLLSVV